MDTTNPFEYEAAINLSVDAIIDYYIEDHNYSRFLTSKRNVFLVGERGCGKTMSLVYNSLCVQLRKSEKEKKSPTFDFIGVYIPCKTPLTHKTEHELLDTFQASLLSEHYLSLSIAYELIDTLRQIPNLIDSSADASFRKSISFTLNMEIPPDVPLFNGIKLALQREATLTQQELNAPEQSRFYKNVRSFASLVLPLLEIVRDLPALKSSHFMLMLDDAHDLNDHQIRSLNSWIAYRDHSAFSFKVATAKIGRPHKITSSGGSIFEGHDYIQVDLEQPYQNDESNFGKLAERIIQRRLNEVGIDRSPSEFFPISATFESELEKCKERTRERARSMYPEGDRRIADYIYKHARAEWFRSRPVHANLPAYSGFQTIVFLSTGVVRNLLEPCYWMYDDALSQVRNDSVNDARVDSIDPKIQRERIIDRSKRLWERVKEDLDKSIEGCSRKQAEQVFNLFDRLALLFRERLERHRSEPRAISFSISGTSEPEYEQLLTLLNIARKAQLLYARTGPAKEKGRIETYYVPNRMLWPARGLDPHGQHARVSLPAVDLWNAAQGKNLPFTEDDAPVSDEAVDRQKELFND